MAEHGERPFDEVEQACFPEADSDVAYTAFTPRMLDATAAGACLILNRDTYLEGRMREWEHYVPLDTDFSNIEEVLAAMADVEQAQTIADAAHDLLIKSQDFTYAAFARQVVYGSLNPEGRIEDDPELVKHVELIAELDRLHRDAPEPIERAFKALARTRLQRGDTTWSKQTLENTHAADPRVTALFNEIRRLGLTEVLAFWTAAIESGQVDDFALRPWFDFADPSPLLAKSQS